MSSTSEWRSLRLRPDDVLFFRDGKPCSLRDDHYLRSIFPPNPSTLYGALRTRRLMDLGIDLRDLSRDRWQESLGPLVTEVGEWGEFGSLELRGPWLMRGDDEALLPSPIDLCLEIEENPDPKEPERIKDVNRYRLVSKTTGGWSHGLGLWRPCRLLDSGEWQPWTGKTARQPRPALGWYLTSKGYRSWARGEVPDAADFVSHKCLWTEEQRTGVGLQAESRQSETGLLFTFGFVRLLQSVALSFEVRGTALEANGRIRLGGEARTAAIEDGPAIPTSPEKVSPTPRFLVAFATPTLSVGGAWPPGFERGAVEGELLGHRCRLLGAIVREASLVGGWDLARGRAKPLRRAISPGSVFAFEWLDDPPQDGCFGLWGRNLNDYESESLSKQGFGLALTGLCP